jgi:hypothetical protein
MSNSPELTISPETDLALLHRLYGTKALLEFASHNLLSMSDEMWEIFEQYMMAVTKDNKEFRRAIIQDGPDNWQEATN